MNIIMKQRAMAVLILVCLLGGCSRVANKEVALADGPVIEVAEREIDLGVIPVDFPEVIGPISIVNRGSEDLEIIKVTGPCSCFKGYDGDKIIKAGGTGEIWVRFDKDDIPAGQVRRVVKLITNDPAKRVVEVFFDFTVERDVASENMRALRSEMASLRKEVHLLRSGIRTLVTALEGNNKVVAKKAKPAAKRPTDTTVYDVAVGSSPFLGAKDAAVTIVEFVDLQCPYCIREYPKLKEVLKAYPEKVQVVFKHKPLAFHAKAKPAHAAVELALQEKGSDAFWKMHDMIMAEPKKLDISDLRGYAEGVGLDLVKFDELMASKDKINELLKADMAEAKKCNVRGTPTVMINGLKLTDRSIEGYKKRIDELLKGKPLARKTCSNCGKKGCAGCGDKGCKGCKNCNKKT